VLLFCCAPGIFPGLYYFHQEGCVMMLYPMPSYGARIEERRQVALSRATELKDKISDYLAEKEKIFTGFDLQEEIQVKKQQVLKYFGAGEAEWQDWRWQMRRRITMC